MGARCSIWSLVQAPACSWGFQRVTIKPSKARSKKVHSSIFTRIWVARRASRPIGFRIV